MHLNFPLILKIKFFNWQFSFLAINIWILSTPISQFPCINTRLYILLSCLKKRSKKGSETSNLLFFFFIIVIHKISQDQNDDDTLNKEFNVENFLLEKKRDVKSKEKILYRVNGQSCGNFKAPKKNPFLERNHDSRRI